MPLDWTSILATAGAGFNSGMSVYNNSMQRKQDAINIDKQNAYNMELAKYNQSKNIELWRMQNEYNQPKQQMQRFSAAGLNPNMIYNRSNEAGSISPSTIQTSSQNMSALQVPDVNVMDVLNQSQNFALRESQIKNTDSVTKLNDIKSTHEVLKQSKTLTETQKKQLEKQLFEELMPMNIAKSQFQVHNLQQVYDMNKLKMNKIKIDTLSAEQKVQYQKLQNEIKAIEYEMQQKRGKEFQEMGIEKNDPILMKLLFRVSNEIANFLITL